MLPSYAVDSVIERGPILNHYGAAHRLLPRVWRGGVMSPRSMVGGRLDSRDGDAFC